MQMINESNTRKYAGSPIIIRNELRQLRNVTWMFVFNASRMLDPRQIWRLEGPGGGPEQMQMWKMLNCLSNIEANDFLVVENICPKG